MEERVWSDWKVEDNVYVSVRGRDKITVTDQRDINGKITIDAILQPGATGLMQETLYISSDFNVEATHYDIHDQDDPEPGLFPDSSPILNYQHFDQIPNTDLREIIKQAISKAK